MRQAWHDGTMLLYASSSPLGEAGTGKEEIKVNNIVSLIIGAIVIVVLIIVLMRLL